MKKYSVLSYNINDYETIHEIPKEALNSSIEYIYVTDDKDLKSDTWEILYVPGLTGSVFDKCYQIRFNPFEYVNTNIVMRIDGSMTIEHDVMPLFERFEQEEYDASVMIHPWRTTMVSEYSVWCNYRNYPVEQAVKCLEFMNDNWCYDVNNCKGLYQGNFVIQRNDGFNNSWNSLTYGILKDLATEPDTIERLDQTIWSALLNMIWSYKKIMPVDANILNGGYFKWCHHKTEEAFPVNGIIAPYLFNKPVETIK